MAALLQVTSVGRQTAQIAIVYEFGLVVVAVLPRTARCLTDVESPEFYDEDSRVAGVFPGTSAK
jgi:hypothetical protein